MSVDASAAGSEVDCPTCNAKITIPEAEQEAQQEAAQEAQQEAAPQAPPPGHSLNPIDSSAAAKEHKQYAVPMHDAPSEVLIKKPSVPLEVAAKKGSEMTLHIKTIKRSDCVEVGHDRFDELVSAFLAKIGDNNIVSVNTISYTHLDISTRALMVDYGVMLVYKA
jgi:hypothetical protein